VTEPRKFGRYEVIGRLGAGMFCTVWLAHDPDLDDQVAIKELAAQWLGRMDIRARFLQEARFLREANSQRVVQIHDIHIPPTGPAYFVMEYANGGTLATELQRAHGHLPIARALRLAAQAAWAIDDLHEHEVLHRDIKPANILIKSASDGSERVLIADLGLAKRLVAASGLTQTAGSPGYMAPEQDTANLDQVGLDERADVYGIGALTYALLTGRVPAVGADAATLARLRPDTPRTVCRTVAAALSHDRADRPASARAVAEVLDAAARRLGPRTVSAGVPRPRKRLTAAVLAAAAVLVVLGVPLVAGIWPWSMGSAGSPAQSRAGAESAADTKTTRIVSPTDGTNVLRDVEVTFFFTDADMSKDTAVVLSICIGPDAQKCYLESRVFASDGNTGIKSVSLGGEKLPPGAQGRFILRLDLMPVDRYLQLTSLKTEETQQRVWDSDGFAAGQLGTHPLQLVRLHRVS
jgi:hypothetical protein